MARAQRTSSRTRTQRPANNSYAKSATSSKEHARIRPRAVALAESLLGQGARDLAQRSRDMAGNAPAPEPVSRYGFADAAEVVPGARRRGLPANRPGDAPNFGAAA